MPAYTVLGGATVVSLNQTQAWGLGPGSCSIDTVGGSPDLDVDQLVSFNVVGPFQGLVSRIEQTTNFGSGIRHRIECSDERYRLQRQFIYGAWNLEDDVISDDTGTRKRRYRHLLPTDWASGHWTYTDTPYTADQILAYVFDNAVAGGSTPGTGFDWDYVAHTSQSEPVYGIDATNGRSVHSVLSDILGQHGLSVRFETPNNLIFGRKGDGVLPVPTPSIRQSESTGEALTRNPNQIRIVGSRNWVHVRQIVMEPDWKSGYEQFVANEPGWRKEIRDLDSRTPTTQQEWWEDALRATTITVKEYATLKGDANLIDRRRFGDVGRDGMPAWTYIQEVVFKAYRIPSTFNLGGVPFESLKIAPALIVGMDIAGAPSDPPGNVLVGDANEFYPDTRAFVAAKGQPLSILDDRVLQSLSDPATDLQNIWQPVNEFTLDQRNGVIFFKTPVFQTGTFTTNPATNRSLFNFPNRKDGSDAPDTPEYQNIITPNPLAEISAAPVVASLCFERELYSFEKGNGRRHGSHTFRTLRRDLLVNDPTLYDPANPGTYNESPYNNGEFPDAIAEDLADVALAAPETYVSGSFVHVGTVGHALTESTDRVSARLNFGRGFTETIEYSAEKPTMQLHTNERLLERRHRLQDMPNEIREAKAKADLLERLVEASAVGDQNNKARSRVKQKSIQSLFDKVPGVEDGSTRFLPDDAGDFEIGDGVFSDEDHVTGKTGTKFEGVTLNASGDDQIIVVSQGRIPCRVQGPFNPGDRVGYDEGEGFCKVGGPKEVGIIVQDNGYSGSEIIYATVELNATATEKGSLYVYAKGNQVAVTTGFVTPFGIPYVGLSGTDRMQGEEHVFETTDIDLSDEGDHEVDIVLFYEWEPGSLDTGGGNYVPEGFIDIVFVRLTFSTGTFDWDTMKVEPEVSPGSGNATTNGRNYFPIGKFVWEGTAEEGRSVLSARNEGNRTVRVCGIIGELIWNGP